MLSDIVTLSRDAGQAEVRSQDFSSLKLPIVFSCPGRMQGAFFTAPRKNVVGMCLKSTSSYSLSRLARWQSHHACFSYATQGFPPRCETSSRSYMETFISPFRNYVGIRHISWLLRLRSRAADPNGVPDGQEDLTKAAILEKVMKGRQPTDLMLRCASLFLSSVCPQLTRWLGTILDAEGASTWSFRVWFCLHDSKLKEM